jgi:hypothetical protein
MSQGVKTATKCRHTHRPEKARGFCGACYNAWLADTNPGYRARRIARFKAWKEANPEKWALARSRLSDRQQRYQRHSDLRRKYGIEPDQYEELLIKQGGVCAICEQPESQPDRKSLSVDHCHRTHRIRGLLCSRCNTGIGKFNDDPGLLMRAAKYLSKE